MLDTFWRYAQAYRLKIINKLFGTVTVKHHGKKKGEILLSFINYPFTLAPNQFLSDAHSNYWVVKEIAKILSQKGYDVDVIDWTNVSFIPKKKYAACIDIHNNLEKFAPFLPDSCIKIQLLLGSHWKFQNDAEEKRRRDLKERKGIELSLKREVPPSHFEKYADFIVGYGNDFVRQTFPLPAGKKIFSLPDPVMEAYEFPEEKNFSKARKHFLWFGGGGAILKGLDLAVETFAKLPHLTLTIIGPAAVEKDFEEIYREELKLPNIIRYGKSRKKSENGPIMVGERSLFDIIKECGALLGLSASEGASGATLQAMMAGVFPIITPNMGIDEHSPSIILKDPTIENIEKAVIEFSNIQPEELENLSREVWSFTKRHYEKESFSKEFEQFIDHEVKLS